MKNLILTICLLLGIVLISGCSAGSALSLRSIQANRLSLKGEKELIRTVRETHKTWHIVIENLIEN